MKHRLCIVAVVLSGASLSLALRPDTAYPSPPAATPTTAPDEVLIAKREKEPIRKADFDMLVPLLEENAKAYAENRLEPYRLDLWLTRWAKYDVDSTDSLVETLNTAIKKYPRNNVVLMRIINDLITPLHHTGSWAPTPETAKKVLDVVLPVRAQQKYMDIPKVDPRILPKLQMPSVADTKNATPDMLLRKTAEVQKMRDQKMKTEWPAITNNEQLWELDGRIFLLRLMLANEDEDKKLLKEITDTAVARSDLFNRYFSLLAKAINDNNIKEPRIKPFFLAIKTLCEGANKKETLNQEFIKKLADSGTRTPQWQLIEALSTPGSKITDDQKKLLAKAGLDEATLRKAFSECPFEKSQTGMSTWLVIFRPDEESEFKTNRLYLPGVISNMKSLAEKCGETPPVLSK